jgi:hypothetical protein
MMYVGMRSPPVEVLEREPVLSDPFPVMRCSCISVEAFRRTIGALAATALVLGVQAGPAAAAAIEPLKDCYVSAGEQEQRRETVTVRGTGFSANSTVDIAVDGVVQVSGKADPVGEFFAEVKAPYQARGQRPFTVTVAERGNPANVATATSDVTALTVNLRPRRAAPGRRVRFRGRGFTGSGAVFAHYLYSGRVRRSIRIARPQGDCGTFTVRRRQIPVRRPRTGDWTLQVDQRRDYSDAPGTNWVRLLIKVREFFRPVD